MNTVSDILFNDFSLEKRVIVNEQGKAVHADTGKQEMFPRMTNLMSGHGFKRDAGQRTMSDQELSEGVDSALGRATAGSTPSASERLQRLRASVGRTDNNSREKEAAGAGDFDMPNTTDMSMFDTQSKPRSYQLGDTPTRPKGGMPDPNATPVEGQKGYRNPQTSFENRGFGEDAYGKDAGTTLDMESMMRSPGKIKPPEGHDRRLKTGGFARNLADSTIDRLTALRTGNNPFSSKGAAAGQRERLGIDQTTQADRVQRQTANMADEKARRIEGKKAARLNAVTARAPGAAGLPGGREVQGAVAAATTEESAQPATETTPASSSAEGMSVEDAKQTLGGTAQDEKPKTGAPLFAGEGGGVKIPGWRGAAEYAKKNPGKAGLMAGLPAAAGFLGGLAEAGINLANQGYQAIQQRQNPNLKRASHDMLEYSPELAMLIKSQTHMRQLRDARSTEVIRYAYG